MKPKTGLALGGRYELQDLIAVGGMGEVWSAYDKALRRDVALKVLREEFTGHQEFLRRLRTEARNSAALAHPNIAQMYDYGEEKGTGYLVMELVHGEPLSDLLERQKTIPPKQLLPILAQTARGLQHAHQNSVVHRDVKPGNILLAGAPGAENPGVKITDFGVSRAANQAPMTATGMVMGTAQYLSPEQAIGKLATGRSDIYALGVVAYEAVSGKRPFTGKSPVDIAIAHVNSPVPPLPPETDPALAALIMRMLAKEPSTRPGDAGRLARELDQLASAYGAPPSEPSPVVGVGVSPEPEVIASGVTTDQKPDHVEPIAVGVTQAPRKPRQAGHLPAIAGQIAVANLPDSPAIPQMRVVARRSDEPDSQPQVVQPAPQPPPKPDRTSDITARRAALAVLIGIFAILGLLLVMQAIRGRAADPVQIVETTDAGSVESMSWNSERLSHGG